MISKSLSLAQTLDISLLSCPTLSLIVCLQAIILPQAYSYTYVPYSA